MNELLLHEESRTPALDARLGWFNPPKSWRLDARGPSLVVESDGQTDFWQQTHYGFSADNGRFLGAELRGDFVLSTKVRLYPAHQYDQAGLMVRGDGSCWIKASVEQELEGHPQLGAVVTNHGYSDWSLTRAALSTCERARSPADTGSLAGYSSLRHCDSRC
jgi:uncharacterized protein